MEKGDSLRERQERTASGCECERLVFVEFREEGKEVDLNGGVRDAQDVVSRLDEAAGRGDIGEALPRVDGPDVLRAEAGVVVHAKLKLAEGVVLGEDFDAEEWGEADDGIFGVGGAEDADVGDAEVVGGGLDALLGEGADLPETAVVAEECAEEALKTCVGLFAHVALLEDAGEKVAVWAVGRPEVLGEGDEGRGRHGESIAPGWDAREAEIWWRRQERT